MMNRVPTNQSAPSQDEFEEKVRSLGEFIKASLNLLEDFNLEQSRLKETQRATLNIIEDFNDEGSNLKQTYRAMLNILEDFDTEKKNVETASLLLSNEITERKQAEAKAQQVTRIKSEFTAMVSHELRTPLAVIKEGLDIVVDGTSGPLNADQQKYLETANRNVDRLGRLINDVLDYQKFESGHVDFNMTLQDMNQLVGEIVQGFLPVAEKKGLELTAVYQKDLPQGMCDKDKITQVLTNLINNAVKFTAEGGVKVTTDSGDNWIRISIHDTGAGIKAEDRPKLFQSFSQLSAGGARKTGGTGLGLAISREIVTNHHGRIEVDSVYGKGSTFHVILPIADRRKHSG